MLVTHKTRVMPVARAISSRATGVSEAGVGSARQQLAQVNGERGALVMTEVRDLGVTG